MRITNTEAARIYNYLVEQDLFSDELKIKLQANIKKYDLAREPSGDGKRLYSRKRYTCPFFNNMKLGCGIPATHKPLGCLAFNAKEPGVTEGGRCGSPPELLESIKSDNQISPDLPYFPWDTLPIPVAVLKIAEFRESKTLS